MNIFEFFQTNPKVKTIIDSDKITVSDSCDGFNIMLLASDFMSGNSTLFVVLPSLYLAQRYYDSLSRILPFDDVLFFPADELVSAEMISASGANPPGTFLLLILIFKLHYNFSKNVKI